MLAGVAQVVKTGGVIYTEHLLPRSTETIWCSNKSKRQIEVTFLGEEWMAVKPDRWIRRKALEQKMIEPFTDRQVREGGISHGASSDGYDIRGLDEVGSVTNVYATIVHLQRF